MAQKEVKFTNPRAKQADEWVNQRSESKSKAKEEKNKRLTIDIPESLHRELKAKVATEGTSIKNLLVGLIESYLHK